MVGANTIFFLMSGTALLSFIGMYFFAYNQKVEFKQKNKLLNTALCSLQEERAKLIVKSDGVFIQNTTQQAEIAHLNEEIRVLRCTIDRLEMDNKEVVKEYKSLESLVFESNNGNGVDAFQKVIGRYLRPR